MNTFRTNLEALASSLDERAEDASALDTAMAAAIRAATTPVELCEVLRLERVAELSWTGDGELPRGDLDAIWASIARFDSPTARAEGLGVVGALATLTEESTLLPDDGLREVKRGTLAVLDCHAGDLWSFSRHRNASLRGAAALLLARRPGASIDDAGALLDAARADKSAEARAAQLLAAAVIDLRDPSRSLQTEIAEFARAHRADRKPLLRHIATLCLLLSTATLDEEMVVVLTSALAKPTSLPLGWGFMSSKRAASSTGDLFGAALARLPIDGAKLVAAVPMLARGARDANRLMRLAFGSPRVLAPPAVSRVRHVYPKIPPGGVVVRELDRLQLAVVERLGEIGCDFADLHALGVQVGKDLSRLLRAPDSRFVPLQLRDREETVRHWHPEIAWRRHVLEDLAAPQAVIHALLDAFDDSHALLAVVLDRMSRVVLRGAEAFRDPAVRARDRALLERLLDALVARGADAGALLEPFVSRVRPLGHDDLPALGVLLIHASGAHGAGPCDTEEGCTAIEEAARIFT